MQFDGAASVRREGVAAAGTGTGGVATVLSIPSKILVGDGRAVSLETRGVAVGVAELELSRVAGSLSSLTPKPTIARQFPNH